MTERRRRSRVSLEMPMTMLIDGQKASGLVHDLSLKGVSCATEDWVVPGQECDLTLELESGLRIHMHGRVVRSGPDGAVDFLSMDEVSFGHLRNLVRLYAEDADAVDDELRSPAFSSE